MGVEVLVALEGFAAFGTFGFAALGLEVERFARVGMSGLRIPV
jgi:hypothetical protein